LSARADLLHDVSQLETFEGVSGRGLYGSPYTARAKRRKVQTRDRCDASAAYNAIGKRLRGVRCASVCGVFSGSNMSVDGATRHAAQRRDQTFRMRVLGARIRR